MTPEEAPEEAKEYLRAVEAHLQYPFVEQYFSQVTLAYLPGPGQQPVPFWVIEFKDGLYSALAWTDSEGNWGTGGWKLRDREAAAVKVGLSYFQNNPSARSLEEVMKALEAARAARPAPRTGWRDRLLRRG